MPQVMNSAAVVYLLALALKGGQSSVFLSETYQHQYDISSFELCQHAREEFGETAYAERNLTFYARQPVSLLTGHLGQLKGKTQGNLLAQIYSYDLLLSEAMLDEGLSNLGVTRNLRQAAHKLVTGQPIRVVALGGSVTKGHGPVRRENAYLNRIFVWINETFPHSEHQLINHAIPAHLQVTSSYFSPCVLSLVDDETDLVLVEFTFNDTRNTKLKQLEAKSMRGLERLLRKLMRMPKRPGILYLHYWAGRVERVSFVDTVEDTVNIILKYYGLFGLSMRDSLHRMAFNESMMTQFFYSNGDIHPTCLGSRFLADLVIGHLQDLAASEILDHHSATLGDHAGSLHEHIFGESREERVLGPPLQDSNWANLTEICIFEDKFEALVHPEQGFQWINEGQDNSPKWGYVAETPGDKLLLDVPINEVDTIDNALTIGLGFLVSYEHMGMASVACIAGCNCSGKNFSFLHPQWEMSSITTWKPVDVWIDKGVDTCTLSVVVLNETKSEPPEHKVKLTSVMLTGESGFIRPCFAGDCR